MVDLAIADERNDETRAEIDTLERGTPGLERQMRAAQNAVDAEDAEQRAVAGVLAAGGWARSMQKALRRFRYNGLSS